MTKGEFQGEAEGINGGGRWNDAAEAGGNALCWEGVGGRGLGGT